MSALRRYEILLPLLFNDGTPVPEALLAETFAELRTKFGAASWKTQVLRGAWAECGVVYQDNLLCRCGGRTVTSGVLPGFQGTAQSPIRPARCLDYLPSD